MTLVPFKPGDARINRSGRPKRKHISDAMLAELKRKPEGEVATYAQLIARTAVRAALDGDAVWAKLLLAYTEGLPTQPVEIDITTEVERAAARYGVDPAKVVSIYERLRTS